MARRQDHMLEALKASVDRSSAPGLGVRPAAAERAAPVHTGAAAPAPTGSWVRPASPLVAPARGNTKGPLSLGTTAFVALQISLLAAAFGVGWLAAGGALPWRPAPVQAAMGPTPLAEATLQLGPVSSAPSQGGSPAPRAASSGGVFTRRAWTVDDLHRHGGPQPSCCPLLLSPSQGRAPARPAASDTRRSRRMSAASRSPRCARRPCAPTSASAGTATPAPPPS